MGWTHETLPRLDGKVALVTGANSGLGFETTWMLASRGARVLMACRNPEKAEAALAQVRAKVPDAAVELVRLDLASLASVAEAAEDVARRAPALDVLVNNAGVMAIPLRHTADGFEMQMGTNHFGHFALTARLWPLLKAAGARAPARVVNVSSGMHRVGRMRWDDLDARQGYDKWLVYGMSKLANLLFHFELDRRCRDAGLPVHALAAHPGYAATNLQRTGPQMAGSALGERIMDLGNTLFAQSAEHGAWPSVYAAAAPEATSGQFIGPALFDMWGAPVPCGAFPQAKDVEAWRRLWEVSEARTGVPFAV